MQILDQNALVSRPPIVCPSLIYQVECTYPKCKDFVVSLVEVLKECGEEFYIRCQKLDGLGRDFGFEPAVEAARLKEQAQLERITQLEARIRELELRK